MSTHDNSDSIHSSGNNQLPGIEKLEQFRPWLMLMAKLQVDAQYQGKFDPSDIVQETMVEAIRAEPSFRGNSEGERIAWLRKILARVVGREFRKYRGTQKRDLNREISIEQSLAKTSLALGAMLHGDDESPSKIVSQREQELIVAEAIGALSDEYREVIILRNLQSLSHAEIAAKMERSVSAVRMMWLRALKQLRSEVLSRQ